MKKKMRMLIILMVTVFFFLAGCSSKPAETEVSLDNTELLIAAAASLEYAMRDELIPMFEELYPHIKVTGTYDSSGKLQTQIEAGADADIFMSAAMKQMNELDEQGLMLSETIVELLENKIVLIVPADSDLTVDTFVDIVNADTVALGDPESVPAGQYSRESLENLGLWDEVSAKTSFGTNVTEVLNWVAESSADAGIVYATDAAASENVKVVAAAPEDSVSKVIYPVGVIATTTKEEAAKLFVDFLQSDEALTVFENYGFSPNH